MPVKIDFEPEAAAIDFEPDPSGIDFEPEQPESGLSAQTLAQLNQDIRLTVGGRQMNDGNDRLLTAVGESLVRTPPTPQELREAELAKRAGVEPIPLATRIAAGLDTGIRQGMATPARLVHGAADLALGAVGAGNTAPARWNADMLKQYAAWEAQMAARDRATFGDNDIANQLASGTGRALTELPLYIAPGMGAATSAAAVARSSAAGGIVGGGTQYAQDRGEGRERVDAATYATASGLITALTTRAFGATGAESVFRTEGIQGIRNRLVAVLKDAGLEGAEEAIDTAQQDILERFSRNPEKPIDATIKEVLMAGAIGGIVGGGVSGSAQGVQAGAGLAQDLLAARDPEQDMLGSPLDNLAPEQDQNRPALDAATAEFNQRRAAETKIDFEPETLSQSQTPEAPQSSDPSLVTGKQNPPAAVQATSPMPAASSSQVRAELEALPGADQDLAETSNVQSPMSKVVPKLTTEQTDAGLREMPEAEDAAPVTKGDLKALVNFFQNGGPNPFQAKTQPVQQVQQEGTEKTEATNEPNNQAATPDFVAPDEPAATKIEIKNGDTVSVVTRKGAKPKAARVVQIQPDGSAQVVVAGEQTARWLTKDQITPSRRAVTLQAKADELAGFAPEQQTQIKERAAEFRQLVEDYAPQLEWTPAEAYDESFGTDTKDVGFRKAELRTNAIRQAMRAVFPNGQENSQVDQANALPALERYLKEKFPGDNSIAKRRALEEFSRSEANPEQTASIERDQAVLDQLAARYPGKAFLQGLRAVGRSTARGQSKLDAKPSGKSSGKGALPAAGASAVTELERIFGVRIIFVQDAKFAGVKPAGVKLILINTKAKAPMMALAGHELLHHIASTYPGLYADFKQGAAALLKNNAQFRAQLERNGYENLTDDVVTEEMFADVLGDAVLDPVFLQELAKAEPNLFKRFARTAVKWLEKLIAKAKAVAGFDSAQYVTDLTEMRERLLNLLRDAGRQTQFDRAGIQQEATENTEQVDNFSKPEKPLLELTREQFNRKYSIHFDVRDGAESRVESIMRDGLRSGMVSNDVDNQTPESVFAKRAPARGWARWQGADKPGAIAYVIRDTDLRNSTYIKPNTKPVAVVRLTKENQSVYEALQEQGGDRFSMGDFNGRELGANGVLDDPSQSSGQEFWLNSSGKYHSAPRGHDAKANQLLNRENLGIKPGQNSSMALMDKGFFRVVRDWVGKTVHAEGIKLNAQQRAALEQLGIIRGYNVVAYDMTGSYPQRIYSPPQNDAKDSFSLEGGDMFGFDAPESVAEQKARLKAEADAQKLKKAKDAMQERAGARLIGKDLDTTQEMFGAEVKRDKTGQWDMFSLEGERNLVAVHNTRADGLLHAMKMGGLPVPSIAIVRADKAVLDGFGDITLVGTPELVTPSKDTKVLNADAYSPRYPKVDIVISYGDGKKVTAAFQKYRDEVPAAPGDYEWQASQVTDRITDRGWRELQYSSLARYAFLRDKGLMEAPAAGADIEAVRHEVDRRTKGLESEIAAWAELKVKNLVPVSEKIFKGFNNSGNRSYTPHTLENVVKIMKKGFADAEGFNYGVGSVRAKTGKQFRSLEGIQKDRDKIITKAEMEAIKTEVDKEFGELHDSAMTYRQGGKNSGFGTLDAFSDDLKAMAEGGAENARYLREMYPGGEPLEKMRAFLDKLRNLPTEYFEAKPRRAVQLQEFSGAVVPEGTSPELIKQLQRRGLTVSTYKKGDAEDRRRAVSEVAQERGDMFSLEKKQFPERFALAKPIKGPTGASIVGYEWRSTMGEKYSAREGGMVEARVSDWDNADESTGTGRSIVHVFHVEHPNGKVHPEGIRSAQTVLGINESRLMTIAKKERAAQQYRQDQERAEMAIYAKAALPTAQEAAREYRKLNYSPMRTFEENNEIFNESALFEKDGKFLRRSWKATERLLGNGWTLVKDDPARTGGTAKAIDSVRETEPESQASGGLPQEITDAVREWRGAEKRYRRARRQEPSDVEDAQAAREEAEINFRMLAQKHNITQAQFDELTASAKATDMEQMGDMFSLPKPEDQSEFAKVQADITAAEAELMTAIRQHMNPPEGVRKAEALNAKNDAHRKLRDLLAQQLKMMTDIRNLDAARSPEETANLISQTVDLLNSIQDDISERTAKSEAVPADLTKLRTDLQERLAMLKGWTDSQEDEARGGAVEKATESSRARFLALESATDPQHKTFGEWWQTIKNGLRYLTSPIPELPLTGERAEKSALFRRGYRLFAVENNRVRKEAAERVNQVLEPLTKLGRTPASNEALRRYYQLGEARERAAMDEPKRAAIAKQMLALEESTLNKDPFNLFRRLVLYKDLRWRGTYLKNDQGKPITLPMGLTVDEVASELRRTYKLIEQHPDGLAITEALRRHYKLTDDLQKSILEHGEIIPESLRNPLYFPHHVIDSWSGNIARVRPSTEEDFRKYLIAPTGSAKLIQTDYLKAMYLHTADVLAHNARVDLVDKYWKPYDISEQLKAQHGDKWNLPWNIPPGYKVFTPFNKLPLRMDYVLSREVLADKLGILFNDGDLRERMGDTGKVLKVKPEDLHAAMVAGEKIQWVLPAEIADALTGIARREAAASNPGLGHAIGLPFRKVNNFWKKTKLFAPWNWIRYEYGNLSTDAIDKVLAADPGAAKYLGRAAREVWTADTGEQSPEFKAAAREGVFDTITAGEAGELTKLPEFKAFLTGNEARWDKARTLLETPMRGSKFREAVFRYAKFLADVERLRAGKEPVYAGAFHGDIEALGEDVDGQRRMLEGDELIFAKAAEISLKTYGDYNSLGVAGQWLRQYAVPFWSWQDVNFRYHANQLRNIADGLLGKTGPELNTARKAALRYAGVRVVSTLLAIGIAKELWNQFGGPMLGLWDDDDDLEAKLSEADRRRGHLILGKDKDGKVLVVYTPSAWSDVAEWVGGQNMKRLFMEYVRGQITLDQFVKDYTKQMPRDVLNKLGQSVGPLGKGLYEPLSGKSTFPDVLDQRNIPEADKWWRLVGTLTDDRAVNVLRGAFDQDYYSQPATEQLQQIILQIRRRDPEQWSYYEAREDAADWKEARTGKRFEQGSYDAPEAQALRNFRKSIYRGDVASAERFYSRLLAFGYTAERLDASIRNQHPLSDLNETERAEYTKTLSQKQQQELELATKYYNRLKALDGRERQLFPKKGQKPSPKPELLKRIVEDQSRNK